MFAGKEMRMQKGIKSAKGHNIWVPPKLKGLANQKIQSANRGQGN